jgi:hypothetical protein
VVNRPRAAVGELVESWRSEVASWKAGSAQHKGSPAPFMESPEFHPPLPRSAAMGEPNIILTI